MSDKKVVHTESTEALAKVEGFWNKYSKQLLKQYLDEYKFRFNNRNRQHWIFDTLIRRLMHYPPQPYAVLKIKCE